MTDESRGSAGHDDVVDWQVARKITGNNDALLDSLRDMFPDESAKHLSAIRAALEASDATALTRAAHTLKSAAGMFGASRLVERALAMEQFGRAQDLAGASACLAELDRETARVVTVLKGRQ